MSVIKIQNVSKQFDGQIVLENISLELQTGQIVGLIGTNGSGKTTLLRLIAGSLEPDRGTVTTSKGIQIGYLSQEPHLDPQKTLHAEVTDALADLFALEHKLRELSEQISACHGAAGIGDLMNQYDRINARFTVAGGYASIQKVDEVLGGLGFSIADSELPVSALSGGQKCRAALAKLLLRDPDYLLLDEPTNHLDIDAVRWLEKFLAGHQGGAVLVSHDRYLLDRLCDSIIEIERTRLCSCPGNYTNFVKTKAVRRLTQERQYEKDRVFIEKERAFIVKHIAGQRTKEAQGRRTRLERRIKNGEFVLETPVDHRTVKFSFDSAMAKGTTVARVENLAKSYDDKRLFSDLCFQVQAGQRLGITGPNGTGKSTLLKIILQEVAADCGATLLDPKLILGYYAQEGSPADPGATLIEAIRQPRPELSEHEARSLLAQFRFTGEDAFKRVGELSGGEQSRLRLALLILASPGLLILDEPTNHLDIESRESFEEALQAFGGTVLVVSHDRYFLDRIVDHLLVITTKDHKLYAGNYSYYVEQIERQSADRERRSSRSKGGKAGTKSRAVRRGQSRAKAGSDTARYDHLSPEAIEALIIEKEEQLAGLNKRFADPALCRDREALGQLQTQFDDLKKDLGLAERAWSERIDDAALG